MVLFPRYRPIVTTKQSRILFLDIDGVVSSHRNLILGDEFDIVALRLLEKLQVECQFDIVISSSRRKNIKSITDFSNMLTTKYGVRLHFHTAWKTVNKKDVILDNLPKDYGRIFKQYVRKWGVHAPKHISETLHWRGFEIYDWLLHHREENPKFLIIDDSMDMFPIDIKYLVRVKRGEELGGLQMSHYDRILEYFTGGKE